MGPERVLPSSEDELGEDERPVDGAVLPAVEDGVEEEEEEESGGYYYQPLNQDPDGPGEPEEEDRGDTSHSEQLQQLQHRIEVRSAQQQVAQLSHLLTCTVSPACPCR